MALGCLAMGQSITIKVVKPSDSDKKTEEVKEDVKPAFSGKRPAVDVAILLDTSNSMDGLISQAKTQLWKMVQKFAEAKQSGKTPILRVSVFEYGNTNLPASEGYIQQVVPLTDDLDKVSEALFALTTNGGDEYCGMVIAECLKRLDWSGEPNAYKAIFIAGNEPFTQGETNYEEACRTAIDQGVVVNTIHCGNYDTGVSGKWKHGAEIAEGEYLNIDQDKKVVTIKCPQDSIIIELNEQLNETLFVVRPQRTSGVATQTESSQAG
ncbi:MAG: vWA domain-containing protein [Pirellulaceae bacterium]